jgi:hypothetical protein
MIEVLLFGIALIFAVIYFLSPLLILGALKDIQKEMVFSRKQIEAALKANLSQTPPTPPPTVRVRPRSPGR